MRKIFSIFFSRIRKDCFYKLILPLFLFLFFISNNLAYSQGSGIGLSSGTDDNILDFGAVVVLETKSNVLEISNLSQHADLLIDTMYFDYIDKQPFSYVGVQLPLTINPNSHYGLILNFNPHDKVYEYNGVLNIVYRVSNQPASANQTIQVKMSGIVIFLTIPPVHLSPVLKFDKVALTQTKVVEFDIDNRGDAYLKIDSMHIVGVDASEFKLLTEFPLVIKYGHSYGNYNVSKIKVSFEPTKTGVKDAQIIVYWYGLFKYEDIEIWAEGVQSVDEINGVTKLEEIPTEYNLSQNYPNPFNPTTKIQYSITEASNVKLSIYNGMGQEMIQLVNENQSVGKYVVDFDAKNLPSGVYFYRLQTGKFNAVKKMMLMK